MTRTEPNEIWNASGEKYREINLCAEYLDRSIFELVATLLHETAHLYNLVHDIQDVSNNGYYHNIKFKATAEAHVLHIEKRQRYGWTVTTLAPETEARIREAIGEADINASRLQELGTTKGRNKKSKNRSIKYASREFMDSCYGRDWVPHCKKTFNGAQSVIDYLGKYTHRIAVSNHRIIRMDEETVTFSVKDYRNEGAVERTDPFRR